MSVFSTISPTTPRLMVVGLLVFGMACRGRPTVVTATPVPSRPATTAPVVPPKPPAQAAPAIASGDALIQAMRDRYASTWYHTLTFVQKTTVGLASGGELVQTWYEAGELPGRLRIDTDLDSKGGVLYARDSVFRFTNGKLAQADMGQNDLLVLGFDIYVQPASKTIALLRRLGFDLERLHEATWQGRPVYVVGAAAGDTTTKQFWIDRERLLFVRLLQTGRRGPVDVRFDDYVPAGKAWIAKRVEQIVGGKRTLLEEYSDVRTDVTLSADLFDPKQWAVVPHWVR